LECDKSGHNTLDLAHFDLHQFFFGSYFLASIQPVGQQAGLIFKS